ncbi:hypothetical protein HZB00_02940 [Candidatus Woesearchaeota archaeon]|nr:hypothetical protein [Candidatus Woesearchaeota archaeon]
MQTQRSRPKPVMPSLKEKRRYVVFEARSDHSLSISIMQNIIIDSYKELFGLFGLAAAGLQFLSDWKNNTGIIRVQTSHVDDLKSAFVHAQTFNTSPLFIHTIRVAGLLNRARHAYLEVS